VSYRLSKVFLSMAFAAGMSVLCLSGQDQQQGQAPAAQPAQGQPASGQPAQKNWKDRAEYDLYNGIVKEQDPNKRLTLLNSWKEKYPASDYAPERVQIYLTTYSGLNQPDKVIATGNEILQSDPKNLQALILMALNVQSLTKPSADDLNSGEKAANALVSNLDTFFAADKKPATTNDAEWGKAKSQTELLAHTSLGWIALQKKDNEAAEKEFTKVLQLNPNNAQVSYWLGTAILQEKKPERQSEALFHFARAASLDQPQGGLNPQARQSINTYFVTAYNRFHGEDAQGLQQLRDQSKAQPFPAAGFKIENIEEVKAKNEDEFRKKNPSLALWMNLKQELTGPNGEQYFNTNMKGAEVPGGAGGIEKFKGKLIAAKPAVHPKQLVLAMSDPNTADVTLNLDAPLPGKAEPGIDIEFAGVATSYSKEPFNVTFDVEKGKVAGWTGREAPAPHRTGTKRAKKG
jgi:tetratricopeptide (TPR) repeat protein